MGVFDYVIRLSSSHKIVKVTDILITRNMGMFGIAYQHCFYCILVQHAHELFEISYLNCLSGHMYMLYINKFEVAYFKKRAIGK